MPSKRVGDLPGWVRTPVCTHPQHRKADVPIDAKEGVWEHVCAGCGQTWRFNVVAMPGGGIAWWSL